MNHRQRTGNHAALMKRNRKPWRVKPVTGAV